MLSDDGQTVVAKELSPSERARAAAAHAAALLISVEPDAQKKLDCLAVMLQNGNAQVLTAEDTNYAGLLHSCERLQLHAAALDILKSISGGKVAPPLKHLELLGKYLNDSRPQFRYEAMTGIAAADPHFSYAGAEKSLHVALEMSQLRNGPSVLVIGHHSEITSAAKQQVESSLGGHAYTANTAREAIRLLNTDAPIEHILIADRVSDQSLFVLLQRFRGGRRTHDLPIAILTDELTDDESRLIGKLPGVVQSVLSRNESQIHRIASSLTEQLDTTPMNEADRIRYFEVGSSFLTEIISDRAKYGFYPVGDLRAKFQSLGIALSATARAELLRGLGTSDSQLRLIAMASDPELDDQDRVNAAQQFAVSAKRFGILIDRQSQLRIYDLYNQKGPNDPAAAESLGVILDAVEQR
jgi:CheY-like chemotaxis protein